MSRHRYRGRWKIALALVLSTGGGGLVITGAGAPPAEAQAPPAASPLAATGGSRLATGTSTAPGVGRGADSVALLAQSPWVGDRQAFHLRLQVTANHPADEQIELMVYNRLTTRTGFDEAMNGQVHGYQVYTLSVALANLPADPAGGVDIDIPINEPATSHTPTFYAAAGSGVFPVQIGLYNYNGVAQSHLLNTFLVYAEPPSASGLPKLSVSLTLPVHAAPTVTARGELGALPTQQSALLAGLIDSLAADQHVKMSLAVTPQTLDALAAASASQLDRSTLAALTQLVHEGNIEVLPETYVSVPLRGWSATGLDSELTSQLNLGSSVLAGAFGTAPASTTWVINGSLDDSAVRNLRSRGATQFIVPDSQLSALPALAQETTFALSTHLVGADRAVVYGADSGLTADFTNPGGPVLAATQLLAELAMIQLETPGETRGIAVLPPPAWVTNATFVDTLLAGLDGHPLINPVTASGLFASVHVAPLERSIVVPPPSGGPGGLAGSAGSAASTGSAASVGSDVTKAAVTGIGSAASAGTASPEPGAGAAADSQTTGPGGNGSDTTASAPPASAATVPPAVSGDVASQLGPDVQRILAARHGLDGMVAVLPQDAGRVASLNKELLTAESGDLTEVQRQSLLRQVQAAITQVTSLITLPQSSSITLTSTKGAIPLTVLSPPSLHARVELRLSSERLIFQLFFPRMESVGFRPPPARCATSR